MTLSWNRLLRPGSGGGKGRRHSSPKSGWHEVCSIQKWRRDHANFWRSGRRRPEDQPQGRDSGFAGHPRGSGLMPELRATAGFMAFYSISSLLEL